MGFMGDNVAEEDVGPLLSPYRVIRHEGGFEEQGEGSWIANSEGGLRCLLFSTGPKNLTMCNLHSIGSKIDRGVDHHPIIFEDLPAEGEKRQRKHHVLDTFSLNEQGLLKLRDKPCVIATKREYCCSGRGANNRDSDNYHCERLCGFKGTGRCACTAPLKKKGHDCAFRVVVEQTFEQVHKCIYSVRIDGTHGPGWEPLGLHDLNPEKMCKRELAMRVASNKRGSSTVECAREMVRRSPYTLKHEP